MITAEEANGLAKRVISFRVNEERKNILFGIYKQVEKEAMDGKFFCRYDISNSDPKKDHHMPDLIDSIANILSATPQNYKIFIHKTYKNDRIYNYSFEIFW